MMLIKTHRTLLASCINYTTYTIILLWVLRHKGTCCKNHTAGSSRKASLLVAEFTREASSWSGTPHEQALPWVDPAGFMLVVLRCTHKHGIQYFSHYFKIKCWKTYVNPEEGYKKAAENKSESQRFLSSWEEYERWLMQLLGLRWTVQQADRKSLRVYVHGIKTWHVKPAFFSLISYHQLSTLKVTGCCVCMPVKKHNYSCMLAGMCVCWKR